MLEMAGKMKVLITYSFYILVNLFVFIGFNADLNLIYRRLVHLNDFAVYVTNNFKYLCKWLFTCPS